jgi:hypothetical protein
MVGHQQVAAKLQQALAAAARCATAETTTNYEVLAEELQQLETLAQRSCQADADYGSLIKKLRAGDPLTANEMATLRLLIVGDADYYMKYDEEFERCKGELAKILTEIDRLKASDLDADGLMHLSVLCREAGSMLTPTVHYLESKDRVRSFEAASRGPIDRDTGRTLAGIIEEMLRGERQSGL